jgi:hypothetical protein
MQMEKHFFSYVRVSTARQGEHGVSLQEQQDAILRYAQKNGLHIARSFEERETAAKLGRPIFSQMIRSLRRGEALGVVIHKIDRGARNLKDWADLGELIDTGVEVHFANESLDLNTRGGRLSADIQAVVAADYIRNLREVLAIWIAVREIPRHWTQRRRHWSFKHSNSMRVGTMPSQNWWTKCTHAAFATAREPGYR